MSRLQLRRRIATLNEAINPAGSLTAKLAKLTNEQRDEYDRWRSGCEEFYASKSGGEAYAELLSGKQPIPLRHDVHQAIFDQHVVIPADATNAQAAEIYRLHAIGD